MLIRELTADHVYLACGHTNMRKSIDGLAAVVQSRFQLDPHKPALFLFFGLEFDECYHTAILPARVLALKGKTAVEGGCRQPSMEMSP